MSGRDGCSDDLLCPRSNCGSNCRRCGGDGRARCNPCGDLATRIAGEDFTCDACGVLVDADIAAYEATLCKAGFDHALARVNDAEWRKFDVHLPKYMHVESFGDEQAYTLELRTCRCRNTMSRVVERQDGAGNVVERKAVAS